MRRQEPLRPGRQEAQLLSDYRQGRQTGRSEGISQAACSARAQFCLCGGFACRSGADSRRRLPARHSERHRSPRACLSGPGICRKQNRRAPQRQHRNRLAAGGRSAGAFETARKRSRIYGPVAPAFPPGALLHTHKISPDAFVSGLICVTAISIFGPVLFYRSKKASSARQPSSISR